MLLTELLPPARAATILGIRATRAERLARLGELPAIIIDGEIRFLESELAAFIERAPRPKPPVD
jgi:hypothetical protein